MKEMYSIRYNEKEFSLDDIEEMHKELGKKLKGKALHVGESVYYKAGFQVVGITHNIETSETATILQQMTNRYKNIVVQAN